MHGTDGKVHVGQPGTQKGEAEGGARGYALEKPVWHSLEYYWGKDLGRGPR